MIRSTLFCIIAMVGTARADLYKIKIKSITIQDVGDDDKPTGKIRPVTARSSGVLSCRIEENPKGKTYEAWLQHGVDDKGKKRGMTHSKGGATDDVVDCASQYIVNLKLPVKQDGEYRITVKATFAK